VSAEVRELAVAVREALDVPFEVDHADRDARQNLQLARVAWIKSTLERLADDGDVGAAIRSARRGADAYPVTYPTGDDVGSGS
jgi:hypothetical protein